MSITIKEIAQLAGVGRATVDRALKGKDGINPATRDKILAIVKEYDYRPNTIGKALVIAKNKHKIVAVINCIGNAFFDDILRGIKFASDEIVDYGFEVEYILLKGYDISEQIQALDNACNAGAKSILITPINDIEIINKLNSISAHGINIVAVNADIDCNKLAYVGCDYVKSGSTIGGLVGIITRGIANILVITGSLNMKGHKERVDSVIAALNKYPDMNIVDIIENHDDEEESYLNVRDNLINNSNVNFLIITAGGVSGAVKAVSEINSSIGVVTFDDTQSIRRLIADNKIIATVTQQPYEQGYNSIKVIFNYVVNCINPNGNIYTDLSIKIKENI